MYGAVLKHFLEIYSTFLLSPGLYPQIFPALQPNEVPTHYERNCATFAFELIDFSCATGGGSEEASTRRFTSQCMNNWTIIRHFEFLLAMQYIFIDFCFFVFFTIRLMIGSQFTRLLPFVLGYCKVL